jgi:flavin reductase (DIM6/NTAB) family NADH-FMN oxidoreductase RutF
MSTGEDEVEKAARGDHQQDFVELESGRDFSRLLYANPVCFLVTHRVEGGGHNAMVLSWLSPVNNEGTVMLSMNKRRYSAACLAARGDFVLSVPVGGMEALVLAVGKSSGRRGDKFAQLSPALTKMPLGGAAAVAAAAAAALKAAAVPVKNRFSALLSASSSDDGSGVGDSDGGGDGSNDGGDGSDDGRDSRGGGEAAAGRMENKICGGVAAALPLLRPLVAVGGTVAWLQCRVLRISDADADHALVIAQVDAAAVDRRYWDGKCFRAPPGAPPALAFLGSQTFAHTTAPAEATAAPVSTPAEPGSVLAADGDSGSGARKRRTNG